MVSIFADNNHRRPLLRRVPLALTTAVATGSGVLVDRIPVRYFLAVALLYRR